MKTKKLKLQALVFDKKYYPNRITVKQYINKNDFIIDNRLRQPILKLDNEFRVRQRNPVWFNKNSFKSEKIGKGIKGIYGIIRK